MEAILIPDYSESILNVTGSILKHYHVPTKVSSLPLLDSELAKGYRNVVLILIDAMGSSALETLLPEGARLRRDKKADITSVFPSTTVAATTAVLSGKTPVETGWLGWSQFFPEENRSVILYKNTDYYDDTVLIDHLVAHSALPYETIYSQIEKAAPEVQTHEIFPAFRTPEHDAFIKECHTAAKILQTPGRHFAYLYWAELDTLMHEFGPHSEEAKTQLLLINDGYAAFLDELGEDTIVIMIADHGQVDVIPIPLWNDLDLQATFRHAPSMESRAAAFFIKPGFKKVFEQKFQDRFRDQFLLFPAEAFVKMGWFGSGKPHRRIMDFLGDYIAVAIGHGHFQFLNPDLAMKGQHAGILKDEMLVPLVIHSLKP